jgi:hypothetical protein
MERGLSCEPRSGEGFVQHIIVDDQQAKLISEATESVEIRDSGGKHLGYVAHGFTDEDIAIAKQRLASDEPRHTTREVLDHLRSLEHR